jgi:hypothetical protein
VFQRGPKPRTTVLATASKQFSSQLVFQKGILKFLRLILWIGFISLRTEPNSGFHILE